MISFNFDFDFSAISSLSQFARTIENVYYGEIVSFTKVGPAGGNANMTVEFLHQEDCDKFKSDFHL